MPWKLLFLIVAVAFILTFVGFNLENACDVSLVFVTLPSVPVYMTMLAAFLLGLGAALPFAMAAGRRARDRSLAKDAAKASKAAALAEGKASKASRKGKKGDAAAPPAEAAPGAGTRSD